MFKIRCQWIEGVTEARLLTTGYYYNTVKPALKITCVKRPLAYKDQILQDTGVDFLCY